MNKQITYLISGPAHTPYLVASLWTLRQHYQGKVEVHCWPESAIAVGQIAEDSRLDIHVRVREPKLRKGDGVGGNSQFLDKIDMTMGLDCDVSLYLDADTTIHGDISHLFKLAETYTFVATQWNDWVTTGNRVSGRVRALKEVDEIPNQLIDDTISKTLPSVNGGVWVARPLSPILPQWYKWTLACKDLFISDERVLHLMHKSFGVRDGNFVISKRNGKWNSSPKHKCLELRDSDVVIWHYHGDSNVRPNKSEKGFRLWWPIWMGCLDENIGGCTDWWESVGNKWINKLIKMVQ